MRYRYPKWANVFLKESPSLKGKLSEARKVAKCGKDKLARQWQSNLRSLINGYAIKKEDMYAVRDFFVTLRSKGRKAGEVSRPTESNNERHPVASVIHCFSAKWAILAPWAIVKGGKDSSSESSARIKVTGSKNGFASRFNFMRWLTDHFDPQISSSLKNDQWRLILVDSYKCPVTEEFFFWCREHRILCASLPKKTREDLDPSFWRVQDRLKEEYKNSLNLRWQEHLRQTRHEISSNKDCGIILKPREFVEILCQMTIMGEKCVMTERKTEAANAWGYVLSASLAAQACESEEPEPWNNEDMDEVFATIGDRGIGSHALVIPKSSSGEKAHPTSASPRDSEDEYIPPYEVRLDTDLSSKMCVQSPAAEATSTKGLVSRSKFTPGVAAMPMASEDVAASARLDRCDYDGTKICIALCSESLSCSSINLPSSHNGGCSFSAKSSPHPEAPGGMQSLSDMDDSPTLPRSWPARTASRIYTGDLEQHFSQKSPNKHILKDVEDEYKRDKKRAKQMSPEAKRSSIKAARHKRSAAIASLL
ncbi:hypothetical protein N7493_008760 [Penicillium malachiteum]|uniref:DDE-1 domain-containing protein n=1 Tax=Penicillium malachiteum TaxID=1324776 RepID=A0AAD6MSZ0_9EURO|nr:hypothetical protein N7493_008760 [Penicillium malachiteum]